MSVWGWQQPWRPPATSASQGLHKLVPAFNRTFPLMVFGSFQLGTIKSEKKSEIALAV